MPPRLCCCMCVSRCVVVIVVDGGDVDDDASVVAVVVAAHSRTTHRTHTLTLPHMIKKTHTHTPTHSAQFAVAAVEVAIAAADDCSHRVGNINSWKNNRHTFVTRHWLVATIADMTHTHSHAVLPIFVPPHCSDVAEIVIAFVRAKITEKQKHSTRLTGTHYILRKTRNCVWLVWLCMWVCVCVQAMIPPLRKRERERVLWFHSQRSSNSE